MVERTLLRWEASDVGGRLTLVLEGEIDLTAGPQLASIQRVVADHIGHELVLDLRPLRFMDSTGIRWVLKVRSMLGARRLLVETGDGAVRRTLEVSGLLPMLQPATTDVG